MKQIITIVLTALVTAGIIVGANFVINGDGAGEFFTFGSDKGNIDFDQLLNDNSDIDIASGSKGEIQVQGDLVVCPENETPSKDPLTGEIVCLPAETVDTECLWLDGEAYSEGDKRTQYKVALKTNENLDPECESATFICTNGEYVGSALDSDSFNRDTCVIIDQTDDELITCEHNGNIYLPGEERYQYLKSQVEKTTECIYVGFFCNGNGEWFSSFDQDTYEWEECTFSNTYDSEFVQENKEELLLEGKLIETDEGEIVENQAFEVQSTGDEADCTTPRGDSYNHGNSALSFEEKVVPFDDECVVRTSQCDDGIWKELQPFDYPTCKITPPGPCDVNGYDLTHDTKKVFYKVGTYKNGEYVCPEQERYCYDGEVDGDSEYKYLTCAPKKVAAPVEFDASKATCPSPYVGGGSAWRADQTGVGYYESSAAYGGECRSVSLVCKYGSIRIGTPGNYGGSIGQKFHTSCSVGTPNGCSFNFLDAGSENVAHQGSISFYTASSVAYGSSCASVRSSATCSNGNINPSSGYKNCIEGEPKGCTSSCGSVAHGGSITTYNFASLPYGNGVTSCSSVSNAVVVSSCSNGSLSPSPASNCSCSVAAPAGCANGMPHGQTITRFNDPGCSADQFGNSLDGGANSACQCTYGSITCNNGQLSRTANYPGDNYPVGSCG